MPFKIVRNDITKMDTDAIVNTANDQPIVGTGCDYAIYQAAGWDELLAYRKEKIGPVAEGEAFITPGFALKAKYIIHAVSPLYIDGEQQEEEKLRSCYRNSLALAAEYGLRSVAFPLISTGGFGYPKEEGMRIAVDEIHAFLLSHEMLIYLVVFGEKATRMGQSISPDLEAYIDRHYVEEKQAEEYSGIYYGDEDLAMPSPAGRPVERRRSAEEQRRRRNLLRELREDSEDIESAQSPQGMPWHGAPAPLKESADKYESSDSDYDALDAAIEDMERHISERLKHRADSFPEYLLYLIHEKGMTNAEVYKRAIVDKKVFSKIKNNPNYHPQKLTALCLCIGARLNMDETRDLLARAGYALSPCDKTDIIFSYFIENGIYDMIEVDIQMEEHGLPCIIS